MQQFPPDSVVIVPPPAVLGSTSRPDDAETTATISTSPQFGAPIPFEFTGTAAEYFGIWVPNLLLSVVTLGLYSPWANVRRLRYFYGNTSVNQATFTYHASPIAILKGRLLTYGVLAGGFAASYFSPGTGEVLYALLALSWPALIVNALRFRNRNSGYRGIRFNFEGDYRDAYRVYFWLALLAVPTLGLIYPYLVAEQQKFIANNTKWGGSPFKLDVSITLFYEILVRAVSLLFALVLLSIGVFFVTQWAVIELGGLETLGSAPDAMPLGFPVMLVVAIVLVLGTMGMVYVYFQTAVKNLVWNNLMLVERDEIDDELWGNRYVEPLARFTSTLDSRRMLWLHFTNWLAIVATVGLAVPWARIRLARYRAECLYLHRRPALERVIADRFNESGGATGSEFADAVALDIGF